MSSKLKVKYTKDRWKTVLCNYNCNNSSNLRENSPSVSTTDNVKLSNIVDKPDLNNYVYGYYVPSCIKWNYCNYVIWFRISSWVIIERWQYKKWNLS